MGAIVPRDPAVLAHELLACARDQRETWIATHRWEVSLQLIEALKAYSQVQLHANSVAAEDATSCALLVARYLPHEPLALPLAYWARGNWANFHDPEQAVQLYQQAQAVYDATGDLLSVARLSSNLVGALTECNQSKSATTHYNKARKILLQLGENAAPYLLALEQNYGWLLHNRGFYAAALKVHGRALALAKTPQDQAEVEVNRAWTLGMMGQLAEGEAVLTRCREVAAVCAELETVARIDMNLGKLYAAQGKLAQALRHLQAAQHGFEDINEMEMGSVLLSEAVLLERIGALPEAIRKYDQAKHHFEEYGLEPQVGEALVRAAAANRRYGLYDRVATYLDAAEKIWSEHREWRIKVLWERVELALDQHDFMTALTLLQAPLLDEGNPLLEAQQNLLLGEAHRRAWQKSGDQDARDKASRYYKDVFEYAQGQDIRWMQRRVLAGLGQLMLPNEPLAAQHYLEQAVTLDDVARQELSVEELKASFQAQATDLYPLLVNAAVAQGNRYQALVYMWRAKGSALLDILRETNIAAEQSIEVEIEHSQQQLATYRWQTAVTATDDLPESDRESKDQTLKALQQRVVALRRRRNLLATTDSTVLFADPLQLLARMDADILIEYMRCEDAILAVRADRHGNCSEPWVIPSKSIDRLLARLALKFQNVIRLPERREQYHTVWLAEVHPLLQHCYELLIAPLDLPAGARLLISPCEGLYSVPFAALWDGHHYLVEHHEIEMTPSGALMAAPLAPATTTVPLVLASSADGLLSGTFTQVDLIKAYWPDSVCLSDDPHTSRYLKNLTDSPRFLHIAAHTVAQNSDTPMFAALRLADGFLSVGECYDLPLTGTMLVTLSGCTTASGLDSGGSLLAFQSAFFAAGAQYVLSSLWSVHDLDAPTWMGNFYKFLADDHKPGAALRQTQLALLDLPLYSHPAIWATFICSRRS